MAFVQFLVAICLLQGVLSVKIKSFRSLGVANVTSGSNSSHREPPCQCDANNNQWAPCSRTTPKCIWIDLGAADGNSFKSFMANNYGPVDHCPSQAWEAWLVEANPGFNVPLQQLQARFPGQVNIMGSTAAYSCEGKTNFYLDTNPQYNHWGSSLNPEHPDVQKSGKQSVPVQIMNLNRLLKEHTIPGDWVMVKMDIEGAEWDIMPCLAHADSASLIDRLYMEVHPATLSLAGTTDAEMQAAREALKKRGVDIPDYFSNTF